MVKVVSKNADNFGPQWHEQGCIDMEEILKENAQPGFSDASYQEEDGLNLVKHLAGRKKAVLQEIATKLGINEREDSCKGLAISICDKLHKSLDRGDFKQVFAIDTVVKKASKKGTRGKGTSASSDAADILADALLSRLLIRGGRR